MNTGLRHALTPCCRGGMCCQSCINGALAFIHADYEVDFAAYFNKLCSLGAKYNPDAYLFPLKVMDMKL